MGQTNGQRKKTFGLPSAVIDGNKATVKAQKFKKRHFIIDRLY